MKTQLWLKVLLFTFLMVSSSVVHAFQWMTNEVHVQHAKLERPFTGGLDEDVTIFTLQHVDGWKYGDNFFFVDFIDAEDSGSDVYFEVYSNFSLGKILGKKVGIGPVKDVGLLLGFNRAQDAQVMKYLPGIRLSWDLPGFAFLNTDFTAYIDDSAGLSGGGVPSEDDGFMLDINWAYPFSYKGHDFSIEGHAEYISDRTNELGGDVKAHILAQPQFRYDLGKTAFNKPGKLFVGIEYQYWENKLGDDDTDESVAQALLVYRF